ncbi:MAG: EAL domain-containing protein [Lachnospiraceae bacterium]|nr:EAL domain-containing protein [Lachnospiraceae bacterium]
MKRVGVSRESNLVSKNLQLMSDVASAGGFYIRQYTRENQAFVRAFDLSNQISEGERVYLDQHFPEEKVLRFLDHFLDTDLEEVIEGDVPYPAMMTGVVIRNSHHVIQSVLVLLGINGEKASELEKAQAGDGLHFPEGLRLTNKKAMESNLRLVLHIRDYHDEIRKENQDIQGRLEDIEEESTRNRRLLERNETMTSVLSLMESEGEFDQIANRILEISSRHLKLTESALLRLDGTKNSVEMIAEFAESEGCKLRFVSRERLGYPFFNGRPYTISSDSEIPEEFQQYMDLCDFQAVVFYPVRINEELRMYLQFGTSREHRWEQEELKFLNDIRKIFQTILSKRIIRNSLTSSYVTLDAILQHTGCGVAVVDVENHQVLFTNETIRQAIPDKTDQDALERIAFLPTEEIGNSTQFHAIEGDLWFELTMTEITWVNGNKARLVTVYDITEMKEYQARIERQAYTDPMTGLRNRRGCEEDIAKELRKAEKLPDNQTAGASIYIDLDDFKNINDSLGHETGDLLLQRVAEALVRAAGLEANVYRLGGDEFGILVPTEHSVTPEAIAQRVIDVFQNPWNLNEKQYYCTCSMGIAYYPRDGRDLSSLFRHADIALHQAKRQGKSKIVYYIDDDAKNIARRLDMEKAMRQAVEDGCKEFEVYYQPLVDVSKPEHPVCGAEALVRWNSKELGFVQPLDFVPLAEYLGLIVPIGKHVLYEACRRCRHWNDFGHPEYTVNVNLSLVQLIREDIVETVKGALDETGLNPENLTLEVTEGLAIHDVESVSNLLKKLKELGVKVALDDFGTGYSSLNCLKRLPLDVIKIDKSFIDNVGEDRYSDAFVKTVSKLAEVMHAEVVVEGVETKHQSDALKDMHIDMVQGYLYDKPITKEDFEEKYVK